MDKELRNKVLKGFSSKSNEGNALRDYLDETMKDIKNKLTETQSWEETIGLQQSIKILKKKFQFLYPKEAEKGQRTSYE